MLKYVMRRILEKPVYLTVKQFNNYKKNYLTIQQFNEYTQSQRQLNDAFNKHTRLQRQLNDTFRKYALLQSEHSESFGQFIKYQHQHNNNIMLEIIKCNAYSIMYSTGCFMCGGFLLMSCR